MTHPLEGCFDEALLCSAEQGSLTLDGQIAGWSIIT